MEALILLGLIGIGYNSSKNNNNNFNNNNNNIKEYLTNNDNKKKIKEGEIIHNFINNTSDVDTYVPEQNCGDNDSLLFSDNLDAYVNANDFLTNDQGIAPQPYFKGTQAPLINLDNNDRFLETQGGYNAVYKQRKEETPLFFKPTPQNIYGEQFDGPVADQNRYVTSNIRTNELPFEQQLVAPILEKSLINREISQTSAKARSIDALRTLNNPKVSYEGRVLPGSGISRRGEEGTVRKNKVDTTVKTGPERNLVSVTDVKASMLRPEQIISETNRQYLNKPLIGSAAPQRGVVGEEKRPEVFKGMKQQLSTDTNRNVKSEISGNLDYNKLGYKAYPNERQVTENRTHQLNVGTSVQGNMMGIQDEIKHSIKETTINNPNKQGYVSTSTNRPQTKLLDSIRPSLKETVNHSWSGPARSSLDANSSRESSLNSRTNPTKELLSKGRSFNLEGQKLLNHNINLDIVKNESDYIQKEHNEVDKVYQKILPYKENDFTKKKNHLNDANILLEQINPDNLDPFKNNPYTKPLNAFVF